MAALCGERESNLGSSTDGQRHSPRGIQEEMQLGTCQVEGWRISGSNDSCVIGSGA